MIRLRFAGLPLLRVLKSLLGWPDFAKPAPPPRPAADSTPPDALKIALPRPVVIILPQLDPSLERWHTGFRLPLTLTERAVLAAIRGNRPLTFAYRGGAGTTTVRQVDPLFLYVVELFDAAYLTAYCRLRQEFRTFRVDRMCYAAAV